MVEVWHFLVEQGMAERPTYAKTCLWQGRLTSREERGRVKAFRLTEKGAETPLAELVRLHEAGLLEKDESLVIPAPARMEAKEAKADASYRERTPIVPTPIEAAHEVGRFARGLGPEEVSDETKMRAALETVDARKVWRGKDATGRR